MTTLPTFYTARPRGIADSVRLLLPALLLLAGCASQLSQEYVDGLIATCDRMGAESRPDPESSPYVRRLVTRCELMGVSLADEGKLIRCVELLDEEERKIYNERHTRCVLALHAQQQSNDAARADAFLSGFNRARESSLEQQRRTDSILDRQRSMRPIETDCRRVGDSVQCTTR